MDNQVTQFIVGLIPHNQFFDIFFSFFSLQLSSLPIWFVIIIALIIFEEKIDKKFIIYFFISFVIANFIFYGLKNMIRRPRPAVVLSCSRDFSFPSGHSMIAFASATVLASFDNKRKWFYYLIASLIGLSRIYLQCHYFFDVVAGALIGYFISRLVLKLKLKLR